MPARTTSWTPTALVRVDETNDARTASDGHSRYGAYLASRLDWFHEYGEFEQPLSPTEFAAAAWKVATAPVMSPGYVGMRPDLGGITPTFSEDGEGRLLIDVHVPLGHDDLRAEYRKRLSYSWRDWEPAPVRPMDPSSPYWPRWEPDSRCPTLLTTTVVRLVADDWGLVTPQHTTGRGLVADAKHAVTVLVKSINEYGGPMVATLRGER